MMTSQEIRDSFLNFFENKAHKIVASAPMVVKNDPTLMFTNAGMNQFKDIFLGDSPAQYKRIADTQKCLRVSGKHNDLEEVGHDTYHHTMFEMLGNWSFGDYFKKEAIAWAWEYLVEVVKVDKSKLYVTVFGGDKQDNMPMDQEAYDFWKQYISEDRILFGSKKDNFWEMGETGPCGPCSEVHVDLRSDAEKQKIAGSELVNADHPQVVEIWNLVFIQFNRKSDSSLVELPHKHVDTGLGFERLCMVLQNKQSNYDTDVFTPLIDKLSSISNKKYGDDPKVDIAMRVIADHVRAVSFAIADGQLPSNNKAGYVIRRILRRAVRYGYTFLGLKSAFIYKLCSVLREQMGERFPEILAQQQLIEKVIEEEENSFLKTLDIGIKLLNSFIENLKTENKTELSGKNAFVLYDTYGFPIDLTELILKENDLHVDLKGFEAEMQVQKNRSRNDAVISSEDWVVLSKDADSVFVGYDSYKAITKIQRYRKVVKKGQELYQIVLTQTPFYAESGGQLGDKGYLEVISTQERINIIDTQKENRLIIHWTTHLPTDVNAELLAVIQSNLRQQVACNHTATHLMHYALRQVLGKHVEQKGSLVNEFALRFDFSHYQKVSDEEIRLVEQMVNSLIRQNISLTEHREINIDKAKELGAMALFSEKYGDKVRVVQFGDSIEFCGGTHVNSTGELGVFKILSEGAVAAGIRRVEGIAAVAAEKYLYNAVDTLTEIRNILKTGPNIIQGISKMLEGNSKLKKEIEDHITDRAEQLHQMYTDKREIRNGIPVILVLKGYPAVIAKSLAFSFRKDLADGIFILAGIIGEKPCIYLMVGDDLVKKGFHAGNIIKHAAKILGGSGGGQAFYATAVGSDPQAIKESMAYVYKELGIDVENN